MPHILPNFATTSLLGLLALALSLLFTRAALAILPKLGFLDKPDFKRHIHTVAVPRGGGIGFILAFSTVTFLYFFTSHKVDDDSRRIFLNHMMPLAILVPLGLLDDRLTLKARTKFLFQILAAILAWHRGLRLEDLFAWPLPTWLGAILTVFWIVGLINAFNMIDGIDGLASGVGFISATCLGLVAFCRGEVALAIFLACLGGSLLGFLRFNWHPAKLFMGDTGSMALGYLLAVSGLTIKENLLSVASIGIPLLACGIPVLDICLAVWRRIFYRPRPTRPPRTTPASRPAGDTSATLELDSYQEIPIPDNEWFPPPDPQAENDCFLKRAMHILQRLGTADQRHLHHRLLRHFHNNWKRTIWQIYLLAAFMGVAAIACSIIPGQNLLLAIVLILGTFSYILNRLTVSMFWSSPQALNLDFHTARTGLLLSYFFHPLLDLSCIVVGYLLAAKNQPLSLHDGLRFVFIVEAVLLLSRNYRTFWNFAISDDFFNLALALVIGFVLARLSEYVFPIQQHITKLHTSAGGIATSAILIERLFLHYYKNRKSSPLHAQGDSQAKKVTRTVIFGITPLLRLYRDTLYAPNRKAPTEVITGLIAKDPRFLHGYCCGVKVMGTVKDLENIYQKHPFQKLVLIKEPSPQEWDLLLPFAKAHAITLTRFHAEELPVDLPTTGE